MPCKDGREDACRAEVARRLNLATRLLCEVMRDCRVQAPSLELQEWWAEHQKDDAARRVDIYDLPAIEGSFRTSGTGWNARGYVETEIGMRSETDAELSKRLSAMVKPGA